MGCGGGKQVSCYQDRNSLARANPQLRGLAADPWVSDMLGFRY